MELFVKISQYIYFVLPVLSLLFKSYNICYIYIYIIYKVCWKISNPLFLIE